jgi:predicted metal-binding membrane protein
MLMALLFVLGVMNLPWVAVLTIVVLAEKVLPRGDLVARFLGVLLVLWGAWLLR